VRKLSVILFVIAISMVFSCSKEKSITNQLDGETWKVVNISTVDDSEKITTEKPERIYIFDKEGGTGKMIEAGTTYATTWVVEDSYLTVYVAGMPNISYTYHVITNSSSKQTWTFDDSDWFGKYVKTLNLEKQ
jgi:hypothetical protein